MHVICLGEGIGPAGHWLQGGLALLGVILGCCGLTWPIARPNGPIWDTLGSQVATDVSLQEVSGLHIVGLMVLDRGTYHPILGAVGRFKLNMLNLGAHWAHPLASLLLLVA